MWEFNVHSKADISQLSLRQNIKMKSRMKKNTIKISFKESEKVESDAQHGSNNHYLSSVVFSLLRMPSTWQCMALDGNLPFILRTMRDFNFR